MSEKRIRRGLMALLLSETLFTAASVGCVAEPIRGYGVSTPVPAAGEARRLPFEVKELQQVKKHNINLRERDFELSDRLNKPPTPWSANNANIFFDAGAARSITDNVRYFIVTGERLDPNDKTKEYEVAILDQSGVPVGIDHEYDVYDFEVDTLAQQARKRRGSSREVIEYADGDADLKVVAFRIKQKPHFVDGNVNRRTNSPRETMDKVKKGEYQIGIRATDRSSGTPQVITDVYKFS